MLRSIVHWTSPVEGMLYDDLGDPQAEPHLVRGEGWKKDPELHQTAIDGIADMTLETGWRMSWLSYAETLYEQPLELQYDHLRPGAAYRVRITYAGEAYKLPMELRANGMVLQRSRTRTTNPEQREYAIAASVIHDGSLRHSWTRPYGAGGGGRGGQVAEVWLISEKAGQTDAGPTARCAMLGRLTDNPPTDTRRNG